MIGWTTNLKWRRISFKKSLKHLRTSGLHDKRLHTRQWWHLSGLNFPHHLQCLHGGTPLQSHFATCVRSQFNTTCPKTWSIMFQWSVHKPVNWSRLQYAAGPKNYQFPTKPLNINSNINVQRSNQYQLQISHYPWTNRRKLQLSFTEHPFTKKNCLRSPLFLVSCRLTGTDSASSTPRYPRLRYLGPRGELGHLSIYFSRQSE